MMGSVVATVKKLTNPGEIKMVKIWNIYFLKIKDLHMFWYAVILESVCNMQVLKGCFNCLNKFSVRGICLEVKFSEQK